MISLCGLSECFIDDFYYCLSGGMVGYLLQTNVLHIYCCSNNVINFILLSCFIGGLLILIGFSWLIQFKMILYDFFNFLILKNIFLVLNKCVKYLCVYIFDIREVLKKIVSQLIQNFLILKDRYLKNIQNCTGNFYINTFKNMFFYLYAIVCNRYSVFINFFERYVNRIYCIFQLISIKIRTYFELQNQIDVPISDLKNSRILQKSKDELNYKKFFYFPSLYQLDDLNDKVSLMIDKNLSIKKILFKNKNLDFLPSIDLLSDFPVVKKIINIESIKRKSQLLESKLLDYCIKARVANVFHGPVLTRFELDLAPGLKSSRVSSLSRDLARSLSVPKITVTEVIPGKPYVGLDIPNEKREIVYLKEIIASEKFRSSHQFLTLCFGKDIYGDPVLADLGEMPHLLIAGTTGSGKSIGINSMIVSILYKATPKNVRFIMIDPKILELSIYEGIPHLLRNVITDMKDVVSVLNWCIEEMERRYKIMASYGVRHLKEYNKKIDMNHIDQLSSDNIKYKLSLTMLQTLPYIVIIIDEFADLVMSIGKKVELLIIRLLQKARACGIHLILATQRPSVNIITGLIKANIPSRIAFSVSSKIDSRTILDQSGAESLLGKGDMLYLSSDSSTPVRIHGTFICDEEVSAVVKYWKNIIV